MNKIYYIWFILILLLVGNINATELYISLDGVSKAPNDVNIFGDSSIPIYIVSPVKPRNYRCFWGTYWGTDWGTNWGNHWDNPESQVTMAMPILLPAAGPDAKVEDYSFDPQWGCSYDYWLRAGDYDPPTPPSISAGPQFSTTITAIGAHQDKFGVQILNADANCSTRHEVVFTIVPECNSPLVLTVKIEPNDIGIDTLIPAIGDYNYCPNNVVSILAGEFANCPAMYQFSRWTGDVNDPNSAETTMEITANETITAYFTDNRQCGDECHPIQLGDLNSDCYINFDDFALYTAEWLGCTHPDCDP